VCLQPHVDQSSSMVGNERRDKMLKQAWMYHGCITEDCFSPPMIGFIVLNIFLYAVHTHHSSAPCTPYSHSVSSILIHIFCPQLCPNLNSNPKGKRLFWHCCPFKGITLSLHPQWVLTCLSVSSRHSLFCQARN